MVLKEMTLGVSQFSSGWSGEGLNPVLRDQTNFVPRFN